MKQLRYRSGVYTEPNCTTNIVGYHAITVVGYGSLNNVPYWVTSPLFAIYNSNQFHSYNK